MLSEIAESMLAHAITELGEEQVAAIVDKCLQKQEVTGFVTHISKRGISATSPTLSGTIYIDTAMIDNVSLNQKLLIQIIPGIESGWTAIVAAATCEDWAVPRRKKR
jgi:hypothetical protein